MSTTYPFQKSYTPEAAIVVNRIVKPGVAAYTVLQSSAAADFHMGVINELAAATGITTDVVRDGPAVVEAGAAFAAGVPLTADALGRAVLAAPAAGANVRLVGFADEAASAAGDVVRFMVAPGLMQG